MMIGLLMGLLVALPRPGKVIMIEMIRDERGQTYFAPSDVTAEPGDTLRFVSKGGTHDVFFLPDSNAGATHLPAKTPLVEKPGETIDIVVSLAPGRYYFQCDPHVSRGMTGHLRVQSPASPASRPSVVLLVRHADKAPSTSLDPPLSAAGRTRSAGLADALRDASVTRILVDQSQRTQETAVPLSQRRKLGAEVIPIDWSDPTSQVRAIADSVRRPGAVTLVIGHRNTIPAIIRALGGPVIPEIREGDYDDLYMIVLDTGSATPMFIHSTYRASSRAE